MMFVPRGVAHTFQNAGNDPGEFLVGVMPGGFEGMMVDRVGKDTEVIKALVKKYNMEVVGPPLPK
jgi:mannose-6-phosphate isomerase-like protein (cupin superfamily)